jgi:protein SCO1
MRNQALLLVLLLLVIAGWGLFGFEYYRSQNKDNYHGRLYHRQAPPFILTDHNGEKLRLDRFRDKIVLIAWGYTNCPDICPLTLGMLKSVMDDLGDQAEDVQVLYITVDPERDTVERLRSYIPYFNDSFIGLTGTHEEIDSLAREYGVTIVKHPPVYGRGRYNTWDRYLMTHTNTVYLVDKSGRLYLTYPHHIHDAKGIAHDIKKLLQDRG